MSRLYNPAKYRPSRGGHAQGHLRDAFADALDAFEAWDDGDPEPTVTVGWSCVPLKISAVCGLLWNCTDIMPGMMRDTLDDLWESFGNDGGTGYTYATGARHLKTLIGEGLLQSAIG